MMNAAEASEKCFSKICPVSLNQKAMASKRREGLWVILVTSEVDLAVNQGRMRTMERVKNKLSNFVLNIIEIDSYIMKYSSRVPSTHLLSCSNL